MLAVAKQYDKRVMVDLLGVKSKNRVEELKALNVDLVSLHVGKDMQQNAQLQVNVFDLVKGIEDLEIAIAGGINLASLDDVMANGPDVLIVGSTITSAESPGDIASEMKGMINRFENNH